MFGEQSPQTFGELESLRLKDLLCKLHTDTGDALPMREKHTSFAFVASTIQKLQNVMVDFGLHFKDVKPGRKYEIGALERMRFGMRGGAKGALQRIIDRHLNGKPIDEDEVMFNIGELRDMHFYLDNRPLAEKIA